MSEGLWQRFSTAASNALKVATTRAPIARTPRQAICST
jgi:hypothetical protein